VIEFDVRVGDRTLHAYDGGGDGPVVFWHAGSPQSGALEDTLTWLVAHF
jgi:hypothetical protein